MNESEVTGILAQRQAAAAAGSMWSGSTFHNTATDQLLFFLLNIWSNCLREPFPYKYFPAKHDSYSFQRFRSAASFFFNDAFPFQAVLWIRMDPELLPGSGSGIKVPDPDPAKSERAYK